MACLSKCNVIGTRHTCSRPQHRGRFHATAELGRWDRNLTAHEAQRMYDLALYRKS